MTMAAAVVAAAAAAHRLTLFPSCLFLHDCPFEEHQKGQVHNHEIVHPHQRTSDYTLHVGGTTHDEL